MCVFSTEQGLNMKYKLELASAQVCVCAPVCAVVFVFVCVRLCISTCVFVFVCECVIVSLGSLVCVCVWKAD